MSDIDVKGLKNYCYDIAMDVVYQGKRKQIVDVSRANQAITFWSPNNIKRLFISPDGVAVQFYTRTCGKKLLEVRLFKNTEITKVSQCFSMADYVPMLKVLTGERMCSSIEEIVLCTGSKYNLRLPTNESNLTIINKGGNIQNSFRRLRGILIANTDLLTLLNSIGVENLKDSLYQISDDEKLSYYVSSRIDVLKDTWWKGSYLRPARYSLDAEGSSLANYFNKVIEDNEKQIKTKKLSAILDKEIGDVKSKIAMNNGLAKVIIKSCNMLKTVLQEEKLYIMYKGSIQGDIVNKLVTDIKGKNLSCTESALEIPDIDKTVKDLITHSVVISNTRGSHKDDYNSMCELLKVVLTEGYTSLVSYCLDAITSALQTNEVITMHKIKDVQKSLLVPSQVSSIYSSVIAKVGITPSKSIEISCVNLLDLMSTLFVSEDKLSKTKYDHNYWESKLKEG